MAQPGAASHYLKLGLEMGRAGNLPGAIQALSQSLTLDENSVECLSALADAYQRVGLSQPALAALRKLESLGDLTTEEHLLFASVLLSLGSVEEAFDQVEIAVRRDPAHMRARLEKASLLQYKGDHKSAEHELREVVRLDPYNPSPYYGLVQSHKFTESDRPLLESMKAILRKATASTFELARLNLALGTALEQIGDFEEAMKAFDEGNRLFRSLRPQTYDEAQQLQGINQIIRIFTPECFEENKAIGLASEVPILVVGMPRSGTTLTEQILSSHSKVYGAGELFFWTQEGMRAISQDLRIEAPVAQHLAKGYLELLRSRSRDAERVVDKLPYNYLWLGLIHMCFPNARIVHCRRDPVDTCLSIYSSIFQGDPPFAHDKENIVSAYRLYSRLMAHWRRVLPSDRFMEIDYENLICNQEAETVRLIEFCGLSMEQNCLRPEANKRAVLTSSHWQVRQAVYKTSLNKWRNYTPWLGPFQSLIDSPPEQ